MSWLLRKLQIIHVLHEVFRVVAGEVPVLSRGLIHDSILSALNYSELLGRLGRMRPLNGSTERLWFKMEASVHAHIHNIVFI